MKFDKCLLTEAKAVRVFLAVTIVLGGLGGVLIIAQAATLSSVIDRVFLNGATLRDVGDSLILLLVIIGARAIVTWGGEVSAFRVAAQIKTGLRQRLFDHLLQLGPLFVRSERTGELTNTAVEGIEALEAYFSQYLPQLVLAALVPLLMLLFVFPIDILSGLVLLCTAPLIPFFMILIGKAAEALTKRQYHTLSFLSAHFLDVLQGLTTLKILGRSRQQIETIAQVSRQFRDVTLSVLRVAFLSAFALEMIATISTAIVAVEIGLRLLYGQLQFQQAFFVLVLAPDFYAPLRLLGTRFHAGMSGTAAAARIFEILETTAQEPQTADAGLRQAGDGWSTVRFENVHFSYADQRSALRGVSFEIKRGEKVALIGATGAGKTTVASLLLRFSEPSQGSICLDEVPLSVVPAKVWREQLAWVPQQPYLFNATVASNIRLAKHAATLDEVARAAQLAHADDFIRALPAGYETIIGERGTRLSGGQAQRIALARAFLKDAPLLILDEATANLDLETEAEIQNAIDRLLRDRTALIITHRLSTARHVDRIIVLDHGCVIEQGTPADLLQARGAYYRLAMAHGAGVASARSSISVSAHSTIAHANPALATRHSSSTTHSPLRSSRLTFLRLLRLAAPFKWWMALSALLGALTIGSSIGLLAASAWIIATAALHPSVADLAVAIVGVRFFGIARGVFRYLERLVSHYVNFSLLARLRVWFYAALEPLAPARLMSYRSGDVLSRITNDIETLQNFFIRVLSPPLVALIIAVAMGIFFAAFAPILAGVVLIFMALAGFAVPLIVQRVSRSTGRQLLTVRADLSVALVDGSQGCADLIALGRQHDQAARVKTLSEAYTRLQSRMASITGWHNALGTLLTNLAMWTVLLIAIPLITAGQLTGIDLAVLALATLASFEGVLALPLAFQYLDSNLQAAQRLFEMVDVPTPQISGQAVMPANPRGEVSIRGLSFRYAPNEPWALEDVSLTVKPGQRVAIVGPSGAGKSTLVNVLLRFWDYETGSITIDDRSLLEFKPDEARKFFGVVSQQTHLFNTTIRENLLLARKTATEEEMIHAAQQAQIHEFIQTLPQGYATPIGEQGLQLSGGERQRLAIARALLKAASIVIFDEAAANLDVLTEREVWQAMQPLFAQRAALIITHRLIGLEEADEIIVLDHGRVIERGTHAALLQSAGLYRRLWELQTQNLDA